VRVARGREPGVTIEQIATDFGVHPMTLTKWMLRAAVEVGAKPGVTRSEGAELREARKRIPFRASFGRGARSGMRSSVALRAVAAVADWPITL
jgi:transposase-like protein